MSRASASAVKASIDGDFNDGHPGPLATSDLASIGDDVEIVEGSRFDARAHWDSIKA